MQVAYHCLFAMIVFVSLVMRMKHTKLSSSSREKKRDKLKLKEGDEKRLQAMHANERKAETYNVVKTDIKESEADVIKRDEEIKACFEKTIQKLVGLLKNKKQVIRDLAEQLERLGRRRDHIAAEIVDGLHGCEEISKSLIYEYLDDKYKDQTQAQRRKGKKNPVPVSGTEPATEQEQDDIVPPPVIKTSVSSQEMVEPAPETQEVGGGSGITLSPQPEQSANTEPGTESTMPQPQQSETSEPAQASANQVSQSELELEFIVPKPRYDGLRHAMDYSENLIYVTFDKSGTFMRARPDTFDS
jgi:hypothetical protein